MVLRTTTMYYNPAVDPHHDAAASFAGRVVVAGGSALAAPRIGKVNTLFSET